MRADRAESTCKALGLERESVLTNYASAMNELRIFQEGNKELCRTQAQLCDDLQICPAENRRVRERLMKYATGCSSTFFKHGGVSTTAEFDLREKLILQKKL